jgi:hypothetical protein
MEEIKRHGNVLRVCGVKPKFSCHLKDHLGSHLTTGIVQHVTESVLEIRMDGGR